VFLFPGSETFALAETGSIASKVVAQTKSPANWPGDRKYWHANIGTERMQYPQSYVVFRIPVSPLGNTGTSPDVIN
jgi:hypothetical protein